MGTRVLKIHIDSVIESLPAAKTAMQLTNDIKSFASVVAQAVVTAADEKTKYVIVARTPKLRPVVFGPFVTFNAATKALAKPLPIQVIEPITIVPMYNHPSKGLQFNE